MEKMGYHISGLSSTDDLMFNADDNDVDKTEDSMSDIDDNNIDETEVIVKKICYRSYESTDDYCYLFLGDKGSMAIYTERYMNAWKGQLPIKFKVGDNFSIFMDKVDKKKALELLLEKAAWIRLYTTVEEWVTPGGGEIVVNRQTIPRGAPLLKERCVFTHPPEKGKNVFWVKFI